MGIVWEAYHEGIPLLRVPGITLENKGASNFWWFLVHPLHNLGISLNPPMEGSKLKKSPVIQVPGLLGPCRAGKPCNGTVLPRDRSIEASWCTVNQCFGRRQKIYIYLWHIYNDVLWMNLGHENHTNTKSLLQFHNWTCLLAIFVIPQKLHGWLLHHVPMFVCHFLLEASQSPDQGRWMSFVVFVLHPVTPHVVRYGWTYPKSYQSHTKP